MNYITCKAVKHEKVSQALIEMNMSKNNDAVYFSEMMLYVNMVESEKAETAFATIIGDGPVIAYNPKFIDELSINEVKFILIHELFHLLYNHTYRGKDLERNTFNVAADAVINDEITRYMKEFASQPELSVRYEPNYKGDKFTEAYYIWLIENHPELQQPSFNFKSVSWDNHDGDIGDLPKEDLEKANIRDSTPVTGEFAKSVMDEITDALRNRGYETANMTEILQNMKKTKRNYLKEIKAAMCSLLSGTHKDGTYMRPNRKQIWGLKGFKRYNNEINVLLDTSGSMSGMFEKALSTIFKRKIVCNLIQCDTEVQSVIKIKNDHDLKKMKINGLGGTILQPGIDYIKSDKYLNQLPIVLLTDGYCDDLDFSGIKGKSLVLTVETKPKIIGGNVKVITIKEN